MTELERDIGVGAATPKAEPWVEDKLNSIIDAGLAEDQPSPTEEGEEEVPQTLEELQREMIREQMEARREGITRKEAALEGKRNRGSTWWNRLKEGTKQYARDAGGRDVDVSNRSALASLGSGIATAQTNLEDEIAEDEAGIASLRTGVGKDAMANLTGLGAISQNKDALALQSLLGKGRLSLDETIGLGNLGNKARELTIKEDQFDELLVYRQATLQQQKELENKKLVLQKARDAVEAAYRGETGAQNKRELVQKYKKLEGEFAAAMNAAMADVITSMSMMPGSTEEKQASIQLIKDQNAETIRRFKRELEVDIGGIEGSKEEVLARQAEEDRLAAEKRAAEKEDGTGGEEIVNVVEHAGNRGNPLGSS